MRRRALIAAIPFLAVPALGRAATPDPALAAIEAYLNSIRTLKARFYQVAPNGQASQGTVWLSRPGRMRFQYDPPSPFLLIAGDGLLIFHDQKLGQTSNIPLSQTPLGILLAEQVRLSGPVTVTALQRLAGMIEVSVVRSASPGDGTLTLYFVANPLTLQQWAVVDAQRQVTHVTLENVQTGIHVPDSLFQFIDPSFPNRGG